MTQFATFMQWQLPNSFNLKDLLFYRQIDGYQNAFLKGLWLTQKLDDDCKTIVKYQIKHLTQNKLLIIHFSKHFHTVKGRSKEYRSETSLKLCCIYITIIGKIMSERINLPFNFKNICFSR